ncbi:MAG: beta-ketoacyl-[acyl-carrier-protein] synthase family protein [Polyangiaceae bacterium]
MKRRRVAITGMGVVAPNAASVEGFLDALLSGRSGVSPITLFDAASLPTRIAGEVKQSLPAPLPDRKIAFALEAARQAFAQAREHGTTPTGDGCACLGVGLELFSMDDLARKTYTEARAPLGAAGRLSFMQTPSDLCVHFLSESYALTLPPRLHVSACAAGTDAIGHAFHLVRDGRADFALAGGTDSMINPLGVAGFSTLGATSTRNAEPERASRPFERSRDGFVLGEGAGLLLLESWEAAVARGAPLLGEVVGYGNSLDAHGISEPHPEGRGAAQAMQRALDDAELSVQAISAINAHGTGTPKNDPVETLAIHQVFGERARALPVMATKSMIGHLISAAGAVEAVAALSCMNAGWLHPTINLEQPDLACDLDYVADGPRRMRQTHVLSTSYGFGGHNAAIVLRGAEAALAAR